MTESFFDEATYRRVFGVTSASDIQFGESIVKTLAELDRALLPKPASHPLASEISAGEQSIRTLLEMVTSDDVQKSIDAIDALAHVFLYAVPSHKERQQLGDAVAQIRAEDQNDQRIAMALKALAIAKDDGLMISQLKLLSDDDPGIVASAARLLGFGRYAPAELALRGLVSADRLFESRAVIWALGEIGLRESLPTLEYALSSGFRTVDCMIAMGKIGAIESVPKLVPMMVAGQPPQVDAAYRSLSMILSANRELGKSEALRAGLAPVILQQLSDEELAKSGSTRFHMCLCLARMGETLNPAAVRRFLRITLSEDEAGKMASFFVGR